VLGRHSGQYLWILSGPGQNKVALKFLLLTQKIFWTIFTWINAPQLLTYAPRNGLNVHLHWCVWIVLINTIFVEWFCRYSCLKNILHRTLGKSGVTYQWTPNRIYISERSKDSILHFSLELNFYYIELRVEERKERPRKEHFILLFFFSPIVVTIRVFKPQLLVALDIF